MSSGVISMSLQPTSRDVVGADCDFWRKYAGDILVVCEESRGRSGGGVAVGSEIVVDGLKGLECCQITLGFVGNYIAEVRWRWQEEEDRKDTYQMRRFHELCEAAQPSAPVESHLEHEGPESLGDWHRHQGRA